MGALRLSGAGMQISHFKHYVLELSHRHGPLVIVQILVALGNTMANSFALIYLLREGLGYLECAVFILICALVPLLLTAFSSRTIVKNFPASINTAFVALAGYYILLILLEGWYLVVIPPMLFGTYIATFWVPYNTLVMHITSRKKRGAIVGMYFLIFPLLTTVTPLLGGVIIHLYSYDLLFALSAAVVLADLFYVSGLGVLAKLRERIIIPELLQSLKVNLVGKLQMDLDLRGVGLRLKWALFAEGIQDGIFWVAIPLISFEYAKTEISLSGYLTLFAFWGAVMTVALGYLSDRIKDRAHITRIGAALGGAGAILAAGAANAEGYVSAMSMSYFFIAIVHSFLFTMLLDKMERLKKKGVLVREFLLNSGRTLGMLTTISFLLLGWNLSAALAIGGVAMASVVVVR